jgi:two-component system, LytTR family, sensor kinase
MLVSAAWIGPAILGAIDTIAQQRLSGETRVSVAEVLFTSGDWLLYALLTPAVFALARRWPLTRPHVRARAALHLVCSLLFCAAWAAAGTVLRALLMPGSLGPGVWRSFESWLFTTFPFGVAVYFCVLGIEHAIRYFTVARERDVQVARLSDQLTGARLAALQAQLNPHFLFNSLNTIAVLVRDNNAPAASRVIEQLSNVLRRTLDRTDANEVSLDDELELVRQYLAVEQARFSDRLRYEIDAGPNASNELGSAAVPAFAVQHLVENAVRHGIARRSDAGLVTVSARRRGVSLEIIVSDDGAGVPPESEAPPGHGIENTRERLRTLYGSTASLIVTRREPHGTAATLRIPYRELLLEATRAHP